MKRQNSTPKTSSLDGVTSTTNNVGDDGFKRQRQNTSRGSGDIAQEQTEAFQQDVDEIKALLQEQQQQQAGGTEGANQDDAPLERQGMGQNGSYLLAPGLTGNRLLRNMEPNIDGIAVGAQNNIAANGDHGRYRPHVILQGGGQEEEDLPQSQTNGTVTAIYNQNRREMENISGHGQSSDDDGDNTWLAPRQRRQPRVGNNFQATLPSLK